MKTRTNRHLALAVTRPELRVVQPLGEPWRALLDDLAKLRGFPTTQDPAKLGALVAQLSATYNRADGAAVNARSEPAHAARLLFSFPRDVPKSAAAIRELAADGYLSIPTDRPLRVLDLGAGMGATSWGVARALAAARKGSSKPLSIALTLVDDDQQALGMAEQIIQRAGQLFIEPDLQMSIEEKRATAVPAFTAREGTADTGYDLILVGQVLSELDRAMAPEARIDLHAKRLWTWLGWLRDAPGTALVIVEPALRDRSRHLHAVRDRLLDNVDDVHVRYPCLHDAPCPALATEGEWCHDDAPIDLPPWLVPVARAAGLRWQNISFTPLVLANGERPARATEASANTSTELRVISDPLVSKGKREAFVCAPLPRSRVDEEAVKGENGEITGLTHSDRGTARRFRVMRLDRQEAPHNEAWSDGVLARYDRLEFTPHLEPDAAGRVRLAPDQTVTRYLAEAPADDGDADDPEP